MRLPPKTIDTARAITALRAANLFETLRIAAGITDGKDWGVIHAEQNVVGFEHQRGLVSQRIRYNDRCIRSVMRDERTLLAEHAGLYDLFVPVVSLGRARAVLVTGPFLKSRPDGIGILQRWRHLTGRQGHPADPEFSLYMSTLLCTLVLEGGYLALFRHAVECLARALGDVGPTRAIIRESKGLRAQLEPCRFVERVWDAARSMVDEREGPKWISPYAQDELSMLGLSRVPTHVLVAMIVSRRGDEDPVAELVRRDALQRSAVMLARDTGEVVSGRVGDRGVVFVASRAERLSDVADRAVRSARRFGFDLLIGTSTVEASRSLADKVGSALTSAESILSRTDPLDGDGGETSLRELRQRLGVRMDERPQALATRFERYIGAVLRRAGHRSEMARAYLEAGFDRVVETLLEDRVIDPKSLDELSGLLERTVAKADGFSELAAAYRQAISDLGAAIRDPTSARHERSFRRGLTYIQQHYTEPLTLKTVAHVAGFAPKYFSLLFKRREKTTFERHVRAMRILRARQLLAQTDLDVGRIAVLCGFRTGQYLARAFKEETGLTPLECRRGAEDAPK
jgi:AraC-like DNA-binding protein